MITMNFVLLILSFFTLSFAHAQFLLDPQKTGFKQFRFFPPTWEGNYLIPNENNPDAMSPALKNAPSGIYLTVGTERSFFGVALADNISHLLVVDLDPQVKTYNEINRSFLIYTDSPEQLTLMKFSRNYDDWQIMKEELIRRGYSLEASVLNLENFRKYKNTIWGSPNGSDNQLKIFLNQIRKIINLLKLTT